MSERVICVTGAGGPAGYNAIRSLHHSDLEAKIVALDMDKQAPGLFHFADSAYVVPAAQEDDYFLSLARIIKRENIDVLIPTVDEEIAVLCTEQRLPRLRELTDVLLPREESAARALNKELTVSEAKKCGFPVPETRIVGDPQGAEDDAEDLGFPVVVKPSRSRGARGVSFVDGASGVERAWNKADREPGVVMVQEYVPGPVFTVGAVFDQQGKAAASIVLRKTRQSPPSGGVAVAGMTVKEPELRELGERLVSCLDWMGPASPEIKLDERDGSYKLMEVNPRLFGYNYLASVAGVNLPEITARIALGQEVYRIDDYEVGLGFVRAPFDIIVSDIGE